MSYQVSLQKRLQELKKAHENLPDALYQIQKNAAQRAVEVATEATPPKAGRLAGPNMLTGELKQHWATDSQVEPDVSGNKRTSYLANNKEYASYVDQGHRMDKHFVPGLYIDEWAIGVRIEDDLLITEDGCKVLSADIIRNPDEIEAFMAK